MLDPGNARAARACTHRSRCARELFGIRRGVVDSLFLIDSALRHCLAHCPHDRSHMHTCLHTWHSTSVARSVAATCPRVQRAHLHNASLHTPARSPVSMCNCGSCCAFCQRLHFTAHCSRPRHCLRYLDAVPCSSRSHASNEPRHAPHVAPRPRQGSCIGVALALHGIKSSSYTHVSTSTRTQVFRARARWSRAPHLRRFRICCRLPALP